MSIKISSLLLLLTLQYGLAMDTRNCSNSTEKIFTGTAENPRMKFFLFTNKNFSVEQEILPWNKITLTKSNFNVSNPTRILVHGWKNNLQSCFNGLIKDAYMKRGDFNVFVADWGDWAQNIDYFAVAKLLFTELGGYLGNFTRFLNSEGNVSFNDIYLIGHSLGAHLCGAAGKTIKPNQYNTIFGLDPAGPSFSTEDEDTRLDRGDAKYVEQISTNMGEFGYLGQLGHAAFYPNFGRVQKYCLKNDLTNLGCSHGAAIWYFAESINSQIGFCGQLCPLYWSSYFSVKCSEKPCTNSKRIFMGGEPSVPKSGSYYISVNKVPPFAKCTC